MEIVSIYIKLMNKFTKLLNNLDKDPIISKKSFIIFMSLVFKINY